MELKTNACFNKHTALYTQFFRVLQKPWTDDCLLISFHLLIAFLLDDNYKKCNYICQRLTYEIH